MDDDFRGKEYDFPSGCNKKVVVPYHIPLNLLSTRGTKLFDVTTILRVVLKLAGPLGVGGKELVVELPIWLFHPASIPREAIDHRYRLLQPPLSPQVPFMSPPLSQAHPRALSPMQSPIHAPFSSIHPPHIPQYQGHRHPPHYPQHSPAMSPHYMPWDQPSYSAHPSPIQGVLLPYSTSSPALYHQPQHIPPPDWRYQAHTPTPQPYYVGIDPSASVITPSNFLNQITQGPILQENPYFPPQMPAAADPGLSESWSPQSSVPAAYHKPPSSMSVREEPHTYFHAPQANDIMVPERPTSARGDRSVSAPQPQLSPAHRAASLPAFDNLTPEELAQIQANVEPLHYSGTTRATMTREELRESMRVRRRSAPQLDQWPPPLRATPPPPSPSSRFLPTDEEESRRDSPGLLETIGEDGESTAGTLRNQAALAALLRESASPVPDPPIIQSTQASRPALIRGSSAADLESLVEDPEFKLEADKTLPGPPVPSARTKPVANSLSRAMDIFANVASPQTEKQPIVETETTAAKSRRQSLDSVQSSATPKATKPSMSKSRSEAGLASLEQRLSRPISPLAEISSPNSRPLTIMQKLPKTTTAGALRTKSSSISLKEDFDCSAPADGVLKPPSSLSKQSRSRTMSDLSKEVQPLKDHSLSRVNSWLERSKSTPSPIPEMVSKLLQPVEPRQDLVGVNDSVSQIKAVRSSSAKPPVRQKSLSMPSMAVLPKPIPVASESTYKKPAIPTTTVLNLALSPPSPRPVANSSSRPNEDLNETIFARKAKRLSTQVQPNRSAVKYKDLSCAPTELKAPSLSSKKRASESTDSLEDGPKYDVKSARGGRGGVVTSVAGLWSGKIATEEASKALQPKLTSTK